MKLLLDTHTLIWWDSAPQKIPESTLSLLKQSQNEIFISVVSLWEIQIKAQLGKLALRAKLSDIVREQQAQNALVVLPVLLPHVLELDALPYHHKDPFDRMIIAQSRTEASTIVGCDKAFAQYDCQIIW